MTEVIEKKKSIGRPRVIEVELKEGDTRRYKVNAIYLKKRYQNDEAYREMRKRKGIEYYQRKKLEKQNA